MEKLSSRSSSNNCNLRSFESFKLSPLFFAFYLFRLIYLFIFTFIYLFVLSFISSLSGQIPSVLIDFCDSLLVFISFYLVPYIMDFVLSPIGSSRSFSLLLAIIGDGRSRPRSLSMVPAPPRGLHRLYLNPQHN